MRKLRKIFWFICLTTFSFIMVNSIIKDELGWAAFHGIILIIMLDSILKEDDSFTGHNVSLLCNLGWHKPRKDKMAYITRCERCEEKIMLDSKGNWITYKSGWNDD